MTDSEKQYTEHVGNVSHETISPEHIKITNPYVEALFMWTMEMLQ